MGTNGHDRTVVAITLNPSLDRTVEVPRLLLGEVNRATGGHVHPGGKGVNVTRALLANGVPALAVLPVGGPVGAEVVRLLGAEDVACRTVAIAGQTRSNITVAESDGAVTKINEPGPCLAADELDVGARRRARRGRARRLARAVRQPAGRRARRRLRAGRAPGRGPWRAGRRRHVGSGAGRGRSRRGPDLIKPNAEELAEAVGRPLECRADVVAAARSSGPPERGRCSSRWGPTAPCSSGPTAYRRHVRRARSAQHCRRG